MNVGDSLTNVRETVAWTVAAVSMVLFVVLLTVNITMLWLRYKKRQAKKNNVEAPMYKMEGNPCYEAASMKQTIENNRDLHKQVIVFITTIATDVFNVLMKSA